MNKILLAVLLIFVSSLVFAQERVFLKGTFKNIGENSVVLSYDGASSSIGKNGDQVIKVDSQGNFEYSFMLNKPSYFRVSRNTLYLTPGDSLHMVITNDNREAKFSGKGAEANIYMKGRLFPKGGSFLGLLNRNLGSFDDAKSKVDSLAALRINELESLRDVSAEFKDLERARVLADVVNSYQCYAYYSRDERFKSTEGHLEFKKSLKGDIISSIQNLAKQKYMDVAVARDVVFGAISDSIYKSDLAIPEDVKELYDVVEYAYLLDQKVSREVLNRVELFLKSINNSDYRETLAIKVKDASKLAEGAPAIDLTMTDVDGKSIKLSDFKGKVLYVDMWATWCGPCIAESPKFQELAEKYSDKDIRFIAVSTDRRREDWLNYINHKKSKLPQYNCVDNEGLGAGWQIKYIPRFILIDANFNIIDAYAPRPSDPKIEEILNAIL